jgi:hypothetical protein
MLKSERIFGYIKGFEIFYANSSGFVDLVTLKNAVRCPDYDTCFKWATLYHNISIILNDFRMEGYCKLRIWKQQTFIM